MSYIFPMISMLALLIVCVVICRKVYAEHEIAKSEAKAHQLIIARWQINKMPPSMEQVSALNDWKSRVEEYVEHAQQESNLAVKNNDYYKINCSVE